MLEHIAELVVKQVHGSGGYGMLVGPTASRDEIDMFRMMVKARPDRYIAQPTLALSTCPTLVEKRHRRRATSTCGPSCSSATACGSRPAALTRVALARGLARRQLEPGRRNQGHLGAAGLASMARAFRTRRPAPPPAIARPAFGANEGGATVLVVKRFAMGGSP